MADLNVFVAADADDGFCFKNAEWLATYTWLMFGRAGTAEMYDVWLRVANVTIPPGATINSAILRCIAMDGESGNTVRTVITAEDVDDATQVISCVDMAGRVRATAQAIWNNVPATSEGAAFDSVDFASVIQEIVDRPGWSGGNAINIFIDDNESDAYARRSFAAHEHVTYDPVQLRITYTPLAVGGYGGIF